MIYYPLSTLLLAGIRDIAIIVNPHEQSLFEGLLGNGQQWGISLTYIPQAKPDGIAQAFILAEDFIGKDQVCLILGDNLFYGQGLSLLFQQAAARENVATVFCYYVKDPQRYGVINFDKSGQPISLEEKPKNPTSHFAVTGLYFYSNDVVAIAKDLKPSARGELEITDVNQYYLNEKRLHAEIFGRGMAWLDTGTPSALVSAAHFMETIELRQGLKVCCPEEIAWRRGFITDEHLHQLASQHTNEYNNYLLEVLKDKRVYG